VGGGKKKRIAQLESQLSALQQLLEVQEMTVLEQSRNLEHTLEELREAQADLERRVRDRTADLSQANLLLEEAVRETERSAIEAEQANRSKGEFLANVSHEIRTPLNGIIGMTGFLLDSDLNEDQSGCARTVRTCGESLLTLINDILDFSKIEAGKLEMEILDFDLRSAVEDVIDILAGKAAEKGIEYSVFLDPDAPVLLRGDQGRLKQVLINLVGNSIKFTETGEVAVRVAPVRVTDTHATLRFTVRDTGIGIPPDRLDRLFKPFSQVDTSTTRKFGGTGLGLVICKQIAKLLGGEIGVESTEGEGSTFWFTAMFDRRNLGAVEAEPEPVDLENMRVLVVDGNNTNRYILSRYLGAWRCRSEEAGSCAEAMTRLRAAESDGDGYGIVLLDRRLPDGDGEDLCREVKADPKLGKTIVVMVTAATDRGDAKRLEELGFAACLLKPVKQSQLYDCLQTVLMGAVREQRAPTRPAVTWQTMQGLRSRKLRILVAEDNIINQKVALRMLDKMGCQADAVANGLEVLEAITRGKYDLILMDCQMPEMDGYEASRTIRDPGARIRDREIPIIAVTASAMKGDREKCLSAGMDDYVPKPLRPDELFEAIERCLAENGRPPSS